MLLTLLAIGACAGPSADGTDHASAGEAAATADGPATPTDPADAGPWQTLFDGGDLSAWRGYRKDDVPPAWRVEDGVLTVDAEAGEGGDLVTRETFADFELELEWKVPEGGNSGVFYRGTEDDEWIFQTAPEMQLLDDERHADGQSPLTSAGSNFGLYPVSEDVVRPAGTWNRARIVARGPRVEHWLNGTKVVEYETGSPDWERRVAESKFAAWPGYGRAGEGHIGLQDHGDPAWFRAIRVRRLGGG